MRLQLEKQNLFCDEREAAGAPSLRPGIGSKAKNTTSFGNAFVTNLVLASCSGEAFDPEWKSTSCQVKTHAVLNVKSRQTSILHYV